MFDKLHSNPFNSPNKELIKFLYEYETIVLIHYMDACATINKFLEVQTPCEFFRRLSSQSDWNKFWGAGHT